MKKSLVGVCFILGIVACGSTSAQASNGIGLSIDQKSVVLDVAPQMVKNRILVPVRGSFESLGIEVSWNEEKQEVTAIKDDMIIVMTVGKQLANVNGEQIMLDVPATKINNRLMVPLRFIAEQLDASVLWHPHNNIVYIHSDGSPIVVENIEKPKEEVKVQPTKQYVKAMTISGKKVNANVVEIPKHSNLMPAVTMAYNSIGKVASLGTLAKNANAEVAINGTFFQAYDNTSMMDPYGNLIKNGKVIHKGDSGSTIGFTDQGEVKVDTLRITVLGGTNGSYTWPDNWYAYNINHTPKKGGTSSVIFTPDRGSYIGFDYGKSIVVKNGIVTEIIDNKNVAIPKDGFVINLTGKELNLASKFAVGTPVEYKVEYKDMAGNIIDWSDVTTAVGAGPLLVKDGKIIADPKKEGFTEAKVISQASNRTAVGVKTDGTVVLVVANGVTVKQMAEVMKNLGCVDAICMDNGASTGLYYKGKYLSTPGRALSNALVFIPRG